MIVTVNSPAGKSAVQYGKTEYQISDDGTLDLPDYVAKTVITLSGFTSGADLSASAVSMLGADEPSETNYLFWAWGKSLPDPGQAIADAITLYGAKGPPACSAS